jgi:hypothetical protein
MATPQVTPPPVETSIEPSAHYFVRDAERRSRFCAKCGTLPSKPVVRSVRPVTGW